ncbi:MAG: DNA mismatch repair protein MutS, partial [Phycisphaerae bacterium]|nr:DNA mismatch repair protein MutS [Phycisphaerae bacterium]
MSRSTPHSRPRADATATHESESRADASFTPPPGRDTPAMRQYYRFKREHPGCLLLFRMGDFYELFDEDAVTAHKALGITLTERTKGVPMAGVPYHAIESYLRRLIDQGFRVAVCEQMQDPRDAKGVVDRAVTRVLTPGTLVDESLLEEGVANLAAALLPIDGEAKGESRRVAMALGELSTGEFTLLELDEQDLEAELARRAPREALVPDAIDDPLRRRWREMAQRCGASFAERPGWQFRAVDASELLRRHYGVARLDAFGLAEEPALTAAAGALLAFFVETHGRLAPAPGGAADARA